MKQIFLAACLVLGATAAFPRDVLILGEVHDNPAHHAAQADRVEAFAPAALVFEMLTPDQAGGAVPDSTDPDALEEALQWDSSGWPDFSHYHPIFAAAPRARVYGAGVPRGRAMQALETGVTKAFAGDAAAYGLDRPLPGDQQSARESFQKAAHCDALPDDMLPGMVEVQRLRDATLAHIVLRAFEETGGPVAVITGNGHARRDWGIPAYLARVAPDLRVHSVGQAEAGQGLSGPFDEVLTAPAAEREDPCATFRD